jgi:hypothetical protein
MEAFATLNGITAAFALHEQADPRPAGTQPRLPRPRPHLRQAPADAAQQTDSTEHPARYSSTDLGDERDHHPGGSTRVPVNAGLAGCPAAVDQDGLAGDQGGGGGCQEHHDAGYFDGLADAVQGGDPLDDVRAELGVR